MIIKLDGNIEQLKENFLEENALFGSSDKTETLFFEYKDGQMKTVFDVNLIKNYIEKINEWFPDKKFEYRISFTTTTKEIVDTEKCKKLEEVDNYLRNKNTELFISTGGYESFGFQDTIEANRKLELIADTIKNATTNINGKEEALSTFEKFMIAYEFVTDFVYKESEEDRSKSRYWVPIMEGDCIVCVGYSSLLTNLCDRIFSQDELKVLSQSSSVYNTENGNMEFLGGHKNNLVFIKDEKYNINGGYYVDACWDSKKGNVKSSSYCCIPLNDVLHIKDTSLLFNDDSLLHHYLCQNVDYIDQCEKKEKINKENTFEQEINSFLLSENNDNARFYDEVICNVIKHGGPYSVNTIDDEEERILSNHKKKVKEEIIEKYGNIFDQFKDLEIPMLSQNIIEYAKIGPYLDILEEENPSEEKVIESINFLSQAFNSDWIQNVMVPRCKSIGFKVSGLGDFVSEWIAGTKYSNNKKVLLEKKEKHYLYANKKNADNFLKVCDELQNVEPIPLEAYITSYKIIGEKLGYKDEKLQQFVDNRLSQTIKYTNRNFDIEQCKNCFATIRDNDLQMVVQNSK